MVAQTASPSLQDIIDAAVKAAVSQALGTIGAASAAPAGSDTPAVDDGVYYIGTVSKVAVHKFGLQMQETKDRYWNVAKDSRESVNYDGIEPGMVVRLILDAPDSKTHNARVIGWTPADAPLPTKGRGKGANNGKGQSSKKGAAKAAPAPTAEQANRAEFVPETKSLSPLQALEAAAAERTALVRHKYGIDGHCGFCGGKHHKAAQQEITTRCLIDQFKAVTKLDFDAGNGESWTDVGAWLSSLKVGVPVYSYNARGFDIVGIKGQASGAAEAAPDPKAVTSVPTTTSSAGQQTAAATAMTAPSPSNGMVRCPTCNKIGSAKQGGYCKNHVPTTKNGAAEAAPNPKVVADTTPVKATSQRASSVASKQPAEEASATESTFRAVIDRFPTKKVGMVKLGAYGDPPECFQGRTERWFEYDHATVDISRCAAGTVVDCSVRYEPDSQVTRLVGYEMVEKPAVVAGVETSGKQLPPASRTKHVSNRQRNAARKHQAEKAVESTTEDPDAIFERKSAERRLARLSEDNAPKASGIPGVVVKDDPKTGMPTFVVEGASARSKRTVARNRKKEREAGMVGPECHQCGRRFTMAGYSSRPGICGRCEAEESEPNV